MAKTKSDQKPLSDEFFVIVNGVVVGLLSPIILIVTFFSAVTPRLPRYKAPIFFAVSLYFIVFLPLNLVLLLIKSFKQWEATDDQKLVDILISNLKILGFVTIAAFAVYVLLNPSIGGGLFDFFFGNIFRMLL